METVYVLIKMPKIEGYDYTGEYRVPYGGEYYFDLDGNAMLAGRGAMLRRIILRKVENWKPLTLEKVIDCYVTQKPLTYRPCSDKGKGEVRTDVVSGIYRSALRFECVDFLNSDNGTGALYYAQYSTKDLEYLED
jgi:hypothetical protein